MTGNLNLSETIHYTIDATPENDPNYCQDVITTLENPDYQSSVFTHSKPLRTEGKNVEDQGTTQINVLQIEPVDLLTMQQCIMAGSEEVGCDGCSIRFYHNEIDRDNIFDPTKHGRVSSRISKWKLVRFYTEKIFDSLKE